jgi:hypothetical protein
VKIVLAIAVAVCLACGPAALAGGPPAKLTVAKNKSACEDSTVTGKCWASFSGSGLAPGSTAFLFITNDAGTPIEWGGVITSSGKFSTGGEIPCGAPNVMNAYATGTGANGQPVTSNTVTPPC